MLSCKQSAQLIALVSDLIAAKKGRDGIATYRSFKMRLEGRVISFFNDRAYGFVMTEERKTYFLHARQVRDSIMPKRGDVVTFEAGTPSRLGKAPEALDAEIIPAEKVEPKAGA
jgi:cold shock CspA family protein